MRKAPERPFFRTKNKGRASHRPASGEEWLKSHGNGPVLILHACTFEGGWAVLDIWVQGGFDVTLAHLIHNMGLTELNIGLNRSRSVWTVKL